MSAYMGLGGEWRRGYVRLIPSWFTGNHQNRVNRLSSNTECFWYKKKKERNVGPMIGNTQVGFKTFV